MLLAGDSACRDVILLEAGPNVLCVAGNVVLYNAYICPRTICSATAVMEAEAAWGMLEVLAAEHALPLPVPQSTCEDFLLPAFSRADGSYRLARFGASLPSNFSLT